MNGLIYGRVAFNLSSLVEVLRGTFVFASSDYSFNTADTAVPG